MEKHPIDTTPAASSATPLATCEARVIAAMPKELSSFRLGAEEYGIDMPARAEDPQL